MNAQQFDEYPQMHRRVAEMAASNFVLSHMTIQAQTANTVAEVQNWAIGNVSVNTTSGNKVTFSDSNGITLKDDMGFSAPTQ